MEHSQLLRPLSVGEILDRAFRIYRNHFFSLIGIVALALVPLTALGVLSQIVLTNDLLMNFVQNLFILCLVQGCLTRAVACAYFGEPISIGTAYRSGLRRYGSLWGATILQALAIGVPVGLFACVFGVMFAAMTVGSSIGIVVALLLIVPYAMYLSVRWLITVPSILQEEIGATQGLRRSWNLTSGIFWRVFGVMMVSSLLTFVIAQLPTLVVTYGMAYFLPNNPVGPYLELLLTQLSLILALPWSTGVIVLLYYDIRVRREGYDLELQTQEVAAHP